MRSRFLYFIIIPVIGIATMLWLESRRTASWDAAVRRDAPELAGRPEVRLSAVCAASIDDPQVASFCRDGAVIRWTLIGSIGLLVLGVGFPAAVWFAGQRCKQDRDLLAKVFRPGLKVAMGLVTVTMVGQGGVLMVSLWYGLSETIERVPVKLLGLIGFAVIGGIYQMSKVALEMVKEAKSDVTGRLARAEDHPALWGRVKELANRVGTQPPDQIVVGLDPSFFVTEAHVTSLDGESRGRTLYVSAPLCRMMTVDEFDAVIGHEMAHFQGKDTEFSLKFYPVYRGASEALAGLAEAAGSSGMGGYALVPSLHMLGFFINSFSEAEGAISRERELAADQLSAKVAGGRHLATALVKIVAMTRYWETTLEHASVGLDRGSVRVGEGKARPAAEALANLSLLYTDVVAAFANEESLQGLEDERVPHPTDSHPPLAIRLEALRASVNSVREDALMLAPATPAAGLISGLEELETSLSRSMTGLGLPAA